jgi:manganese/zinc/iron transport system substrate-binding protein
MRLLFLFGLLVMAGCSTPKSGNKPLIVCSTSIIADCTREIVGNDYEVVSLMGPEIDPHSYNPRPSDAKYLDQADVIIYNGFHLEGKMAELFEHLKTRKNVICVADYYAKEKKIVVDEQGAVDPHIWFDPKVWMDAFGGVAKKLSEHYTKDSSLFTINYFTYNSKIQSEFKTLKARLAEIPAEQRVIITSHDAFHYFGRAFACKVKAIQGTSTTQEPSISAMRDLQEYILKHKIKALFVESSVNPKSIASIIENCKTKGHNIKIGGTLYSDALGAEKAKTYAKMLEENCTTIYKALHP